MSEKTNIEWTNHTGNPWIGCTKVSPGCKNCYAATLDENRFSKTMGGGTKEKPVSHWGKCAPRFKTKAFWKDAVKWNRESGVELHSYAANPMQARFKRQPPDRPRVFPSLCDWLDEEVPAEWLAEFLKLIYDTPNLDWLLLTKRPENFKDRLAKAASATTWADPQDVADKIAAWMTGERIWNNVRIGASVEDQKRADERIPQLLAIPAAVHFISVEPLLEHTNILPYIGGQTHQCKCTGRAGVNQLGFHETEYTLQVTRGAMYCAHCETKAITRPAVNWVIVGGESGPDRRDCGVDAIVSVAEQCKAAGVPCFVKQDCAFKPGQKGRIRDDVWALKQFPK